MLSPSRRLTATVLIVGLLGSIDGCLQGGSTDDVPPALAQTDGTGTVVSITDGDTLRLEVDGTELRVRLLGIDTPEINPEVECYGAEAEAALAALAPPGSTLGFTYDRDRRDQYDRELLYLFATDGSSINLTLVEQGFARAVLFEPNDRLWDQLRAAERAAQDSRLGLWGSC
jgi:micrococcal nuclease